MKIVVTGATGFVGRHAVTALLDRGHEVVAVARDRARLKEMPWQDRVRFVSRDLYENGCDWGAILGIPDVLVHLAWPGLPNYKELFHIERNLPADYRFLKSMVAAGAKHVLVTGTCFEYGFQNGPLSEDMPAAPGNPYGLAKDSLRKFLEALQAKQPFMLQWVRLFYMYGPGQNPNSLLAQLDRAIDSGDATFNMSGGEQLRDYLPVQEVASRLAIMTEHPECFGIINCCSGQPISVRRLVEERIAERGAKIALNLGHYPYPDYEPLAFWGAKGKLDKLLGQL